MVKLERMTIELRAGIFFAFAGFFLSFLTGFVSGIVFSVVITRSLITSALFAAIGFGVIMIIKKYVPEFYEILSGAAAAEEFEDLSEPAHGSGGDAEDYDSGTVSKAEEAGFTGFDDSSYERLSSVSDQGLNSELNVSQGKMGKHIIMSKQFNGYEPKIIADAVRTMMSKDKE